MVTVSGHSEWSLADFVVWHSKSQKRVGFAEQFFVGEPLVLRKIYQARFLHHSELSHDFDATLSCKKTASRRYSIMYMYTYICISIHKCTYREENDIGVADVGGFLKLGVAQFGILGTAAKVGTGLDRDRVLINLAWASWCNLIAVSEIRF